MRHVICVNSRAPIARNVRTARAMRINRLNEKIDKLHEEMQRLEPLEQQRLAVPDKQISLTDPDARSMATSGRGFRCCWL